MPNSILVAEDNPFDLEFTLLALQGCGLEHEIVVTRDGAQAVDYLLARNAYQDRAPGNPDLVLLDLKMPKLDGVDVLKQIRTTPPLVTVPVIVLTNSTLDADIHRIRMLGVTNYIVKPLEFNSFKEEICRAVSPGSR